jgi:hypothetical protein
MAYEDGVHAFCYGRLPRVIFAHTIGTAPLPERYLFSMDAMNSLPRIARQISPDGLWIRSALEHFGHRDRANPEAALLVALEPRDRRSLTRICHFVQQIDQERRIEQAIPHCLRDTRRRTSPMRLGASASTSPAVTKGSSRISIRTYVDRFMRALRERRASTRSSSSDKRTVKIPIVDAIIACMSFVCQPTGPESVSVIRIRHVRFSSFCAVHGGCAGA